MSEPLSPVLTATSVAIAGGQLLGMPVEAVALGAFASAVVLMREPPKNLLLMVSYIMTGGLLGGALAPILGQMFIEWLRLDHHYLTGSERSVMHVATPVLVGFLWQKCVKFADHVYPSFEKRIDEAIGDFLDWILRRPKK